MLTHKEYMDLLKERLALEEKHKTETLTPEEFYRGTEILTQIDRHEFQMRNIINHTCDDCWYSDKNGICLFKKCVIKGK